MAGELGSSPGVAISQPQHHSPSARGLCRCCFMEEEPKAWKGGVYRETCSIPIPLSKLLSPGIGSRIHTLCKSLACFFHRPLLAPRAGSWGLVLGRGG